MRTGLPFSKYQGAGNDFILVDDRKALFSCEPEKIRALCHRQYGIGADGLILLQRSPQADVRMRIFNADGTEAAMCGNGIRCLFAFAHDLGCVSDEALIETQAGILKAKRVQQNISIMLPIPTYCSKTEVVNAGVPHHVIFVENLASQDVEKRGKEIRFQVRFSPQGVNVTFAQIVQEKVAIRTYERGVEKETLACGTGAVAAAFMAKKNFSVIGPVQVLTPSNEILQVFEKQNGMELVGPAKEVFKGIIQL